MTRNSAWLSAETRRGAMHHARTGTVEHGACRQASSRDSRRRSWQGAEESRDKAGIPIQDQTTRMVRNATAAVGGWHGWAGNGVRSSCGPVHDLRSLPLSDEGCSRARWPAWSGRSSACPARPVRVEKIRSIMTRVRVRSRSFRDGSTGTRAKGTSRAVGAAGRDSLRCRLGNRWCRLDWRRGAERAADGSRRFKMKAGREATPSGFRFLRPAESTASGHFGSRNYLEWAPKAPIIFPTTVLLSTNPCSA